MRLLSFLAASFLLLTDAGISGQAYACPLPDEAGKWELPHRARTGELTRLEVEHKCDAKGADIWRIRALAKCTPRDCTWGYTRGFRLKGRLIAVFDTFQAERWVSIRMEGSAMRADLLIRTRNSPKPPQRYTRRLRRQD